MHAHLSGRVRRGRRRSRHAARHAGAMGARGRIGAGPAQAHRPSLRLGAQQLLLSAVSRNQDGAIARPLPQRDGHARSRARQFRSGRRGRRRARRERRLAVRPAARRRAEALRKRSRPGAMARRLRRRPQRRPQQPRNQDGREKLSRVMACGRHQGEGGRGLFPPHPLFQLPLRSQGTDRLLPAAERPSPVRIPADARPDQGGDGRSRDRPRASRAAYRRRQDRGAAAARLHVQCARRRALARGTRAACRRRGAYDAAIHGPGHELGRARRVQSRLEAQRRAARRRPETDRHFESERKPHAKEMIEISVQMKNFVSLANPLQAKLRNVVVKTLLKTPKIGDYLREGRFKPPPTYPDGAYFGLPRRRRNGAEGRPIPQPQVRTYEGRRALLDDFLGEDFVLVGNACDPRAGLDAQTLAALTALGVRCVALYPYGGRPQRAHGVEAAGPSGLAEVEDLSGEGVAWFRSVGAKKGAFAVIRPDKFVYALAPASGAADIVTHALRAMKADRAPTVKAPEIRLRTAA